MDWLSDGTYIVVCFLRFGLALTFFMHGTQHAFGWHGGKGPKAQVTNWRINITFHFAVGVFALVIELSTVISMTLGFLVRPVGFCLAVFTRICHVSEPLELWFFLLKDPARVVVSNTRWRSY